MTFANATVRQLIVAALDTGMRKGELLKLRFGDLDWEQQLIYVKLENAKQEGANRADWHDPPSHPA
jgi:integrase